MSNLLILDFEANCTDTDEFPRHEMEIIEFPVVMIDIKTNKVIDEVLQQAEMFIMRYSDGVFVTCGDWDLQRCYPNQLKMSRVYPINPNRFKTWINIKHEFKKKI